MFLGQGSYGQVTTRYGKAVKQFTKLSHVIQEYTALRYLSDCKYVVNVKGVDFAKLEITMELYDYSLRNWIEEMRDKGGPCKEDKMKIIHDILMGLIELHDRSLAHGDLKPGNILVRKSPLKAVLGDCGFVSIAKYAKVDRTAAIYRDPVISHDHYHDMFSFGICLLELIGDIKINRQATYDELKQVVRDKIHDPEYRKIIYNLLHCERERRPSARSLLNRLFHENPPIWNKPKLYQAEDGSFSNITLPREDRNRIRSLMKKTAGQFHLNRGKKGFGAVLCYIDRHKIESNYYNIYTAVTLMILSAVFGKSGFGENAAIDLCNNRYSVTFIYSLLNDLLSDKQYVNILMNI